jgi:hypothetical protein
VKLKTAEGQCGSPGTALAFKPFKEALQEEKADVSVFRQIDCENMIWGNKFWVS